MARLLASALKHTSSVVLSLLVILVPIPGHTDEGALTGRWECHSSRNLELNNRKYLERSVWYFLVSNPDRNGDYFFSDLTESFTDGHGRSSLTLQHLFGSARLENDTAVFRFDEGVVYYWDSRRVMKDIKSDVKFILDGDNLTGKNDSSLCRRLESNETLGRKIEEGFTSVVEGEDQRNSFSFVEDSYNKENGLLAATRESDSMQLGGTPVDWPCREVWLRELGQSTMHLKRSPKWLYEEFERRHKDTIIYEPFRELLRGTKWVARFEETRDVPDPVYDPWEETVTYSSDGCLATWETTANALPNKVITPVVFTLEKNASRIGGELDTTLSKTGLIAICLSGGFDPSGTSAAIKPDVAAIRVCSWQDYKIQLKGGDWRYVGPG